VDRQPTSQSAQLLRNEGLWIYNRQWDLTFISLSSIAVILPFAAYEIFIVLFNTFEGFRNFFGVAEADVLDVSRNAVNALIAVFIGGPHMYATYTRTFLDPDFRRKKKMFLGGSLVIPAFVIYFGINHFQFLITFFFFWASTHVMHQIAYIIDCYNHRRSSALSLKARVLDYVVVFSSLYPFGVWRMVNDDFSIGQIELLFPEFLKIKENPVLGYGLFVVALGIFVVSASAWIVKSIREFQRGEAHLPKIILMSLTASVALFLPLYDELDVAFQGFNTWHSIQYLGLTWYINRVRQQKQEIHTPFIEGISQSGKGWKFYGFNVACSFGAVAMVSILIFFRTELGLKFDQCYYIVVLSFLLMHYYHDHFLFTEFEATQM